MSEYTVCVCRGVGRGRGWSTLPLVWLSLFEPPGSENIFPRQSESK